MQINRTYLFFVIIYILFLIAIIGLADFDISTMGIHSINTYPPRRQILPYDNYGAFLFSAQQHAPLPQCLTARYKDLARQSDCRSNYSGGKELPVLAGISKTLIIIVILSYPAIHGLPQNHILQLYAGIGSFVYIACNEFALRHQQKEYTRSSAKGFVVPLSL